AEVADRPAAVALREDEPFDGADRRTPTGGHRDAVAVPEHACVRRRHLARLHAAAGRRGGHAATMGSDFAGTDEGAPRASRAHDEAQVGSHAGTRDSIENRDGRARREMCEGVDSMLRRFVLGRFVLPAACGLGALFTALPARATDYINDPLTDPTFPGRGGSVGGTFDASGWTVPGDSDTLWSETPDALARGSVSFSVTNWGLTTTLTGGDMDILAIYQAPSGVAEPIGYSPWYRNNDFKVFMRIFGSADPGR